jgi:DNA-binding response OmpR family regulator
VTGERILVVEDESAVARGLEYGLTAEGFDVLRADTGRRALELARSAEPDLILLDIRLPDLSGFDVCRLLRTEGLRAPILMLTARDEEVDKVLGLELGADDYVVKPYSLRELVSRIRALLRRSHDRGKGKTALQMVSAWASDNGVVLGQRKVDGQSNEITAIPGLLDALEIAGCIVTLDAIHCQTETVETIIENRADYVLPVKENQPRLLEALQGLFDDPAEMRWVACDHHKTGGRGHGRTEVRECWSTSDPDYLRYIATLAEWKGSQSIAMVQAERQVGDQATVKRRYFISSLKSDAQLLLHAVRAHWGIENKVHWVLDITFREDDSRIRKGNGAENFAVLRHIALNLLRRETSAKRSLKGKRKKAAWDEQYLLKVLTG